MSADPLRAAPPSTTRSTTRNMIYGTWLNRATGALGAAGVLFTGALALTQDPAPMPPAPATRQACALGSDGFLRGRFFGALNLTADWTGSSLACDGMGRPAGEGVRLYFSGDGPDGGRVSVLIGLDGRQQDLAGAERPANVTVIDEREDRFFSSAGPGRCWASIDSVTPVAGRPAGSRIAGLVYCVGALPSVGDRSSLTLSDLQFSGWVAADAD